MTQKRWWLLAGILASAFGTNVRAEDQPASPGQVQLDVVVAKVRPDLLPLPGRDDRTETAGFRVLSREERERVLGALQALRNAGLARVCAEPRLATRSGRPAFLSGGEVAVPVGQAGERSVAFEEFGMRLNLLPTLLGGDRMQLKLEAKASDLPSASGIVPAGGWSQRVDGMAELRPGQALVCCGLRQKPKSETKGEAKADSGPWDHIVLVTPAWKPQKAPTAASGKTAAWHPAKSEPAEPQILMNVLVAEVKLPPGTVLPGCKPAPVEPDSKLRPYFIGRFSPEEQPCVMKLLRALKEEDRCEILCRPQVMTLSGKQAQVTIGGDKERISLNLLPVLKKDRIHLDCNLEWTFPGGMMNLLGDVVPAPSWNICWNNTSADVKDGQMMLVHGWRSARNEVKSGSDGEKTILLMVKPEVGVGPEVKADWDRDLEAPAPAVPQVAPVAPRPLPPPMPAPPAVAPKPIPQPAPVSQTGCRVRVITEEGEARLEIQGGSTCLTCPQVTFKQPDGTQLRLGASGKQIQIEAPQFRATADCLTKKENGQFLLEGNVRAQFQGAGTAGGVEVMGNQVTIGTKDMHEQPLVPVTTPRH